MAKQTYFEFVGKFKPKKTTDDCYTPPEVYEVVKDWVLEAARQEAARQEAARRRSAMVWQLSPREEEMRGRLE